MQKSLYDDVNNKDNQDMRSHKDDGESQAASQISYSTASVESDSVELTTEFVSPTIEDDDTLPVMSDGQYITPDRHYRVDYYKANRSTLKKSYTLVTDLWHNTSEKYEDTGAIAQGVYGAVHVHKNQDERALVSKKSHPSIGYQSKKEVTKLLNMSEREVFFARELYPNEQPRARFSWLYLNPDQTDKKYGTLETRVVAPKIEKSMTLFQFINCCDSVDDLALTIYFVMLEMDRMHTSTYKTGDVGMVHGDLSGNNIMVSFCYDVHFIDLAFANFIGGESFIFKLQDDESCYMPKERTYKIDRSEATTIALPNQDLYTFAYNLKLAFDRQLKLSVKLALYNKFPDILSFICNSLVDDPSARPSLQEYIARLKPQLHAPMLRKAVRTSTDTELIDFIKRSSAHYSARDYNQVVFSFLEEEDFNMVTKLVSILQKHVAIYATNHVGKLLKMIPEIKSEFEHISNEIACNEQRQDLAAELATALEFANVACQNPACSLSSTMIANIRKHKRLDAVYREMFESQHDIRRSNSSRSLHQSMYRK